MAQHYSNPKRANDAHSLPDLETFYIGTLRNWREPLPCFLCSDWPEHCGEQTPHSEHVGWYWWPCFPGCLPDSEPCGPFATEAEALADARDNVSDLRDDDDDDEGQRND